MMPSNLRNVSSILIGLNENCYGLFDCGEGTYKQLNSQFNKSLDDILVKIKVIMISHIHGDHLFGMFNIFRERQKILD